MPYDDDALQGFMQPLPPLPTPSEPLPAPKPIFSHGRPRSASPALPTAAPLPLEDEDEPEPEGRSFTDVDATRRNIFDYSLKALQEMEPVETATHILRIRDPHFIDPDRYTLAEEKKAITEGRDLARRVRGTWQLEDKATGQTIAERQATLVKLPYMTQRGTYIRGGINVAPANQFRLLPGAYTRRKESGEIESHINVKAGTGIVHRLLLEPDKGVFRISINNASLPLLPILKALGVPEKQIKDSWGPDLITANSRQDTFQNVRKLHQKLVGAKSKAKNDAEMQQELRDAFGKMQLNEFTTNKTLGKPYPNVSGEALLAATTKMLAVNRGEADVDNRDSYAFRELLGPEDLLSERFRKSRKHLLPLLWKAAQRKSLDRLPPSALDVLLDDVLNDGALTQGLEEINVIDTFDQQTRATQLGIGGIGCYSADTEVFTRSGWKPWPTVSAEDEFACLDGDELVFRQPNKLFSGHYSGDLLWGKTVQLDYLVTPDHRMYVRSSTSGTQDWTDWAFRSAEDVHGKKVRHRISCNGYMGGESADTYEVPPAPVQGQNAARAIKEPISFPMIAWARFLGYYLADGSFSYNTSRVEYRIEIGKKIECNPDEYRAIEETLRQLGLAFRYDQGRRFVVNSKHLAYYVSKFGKSATKYVPDYIMNGSPEVRRAFFEALTLCDHGVKTDSLLRYESASSVLRDQIAWLAISLGKSARYYEYQRDNGNPAYLLVAREAREAGISVQKNKDQYRLVAYSGNVYCAAVPGGLVFVRRNGKAMWCGNSPDAVPDEARSIQASQMGFVDPLRTPERSNVGVDTRLASNTRKGTDGKLYTKLRSVKTGKTIWRTPQDTADMVVAFPKEMESGEDYVAALVNGEMDYVHRDKVDAVLPHFEKAFNPLSNLIPGKAGIKPQRALMGARMLAQALPLVDPEAPLVQSAVPDEDDKSYEELYGEKLGAVRTKTLGEVVKIEPDGIHIRQADGSIKIEDMYNNFPMNRKSMLTNTPVVKVGDIVKPGQLLAHSNVTDKNGTAALGKNVRVALMASGENYEDGWTISESLAKRMLSQSIYQHDFEPDKNAKQSRLDFVGLFPRKYQPEALKKLDDNGVIKVGESVDYGEPLVLSAVPAEITKDSVNRGKRASYADRSLTWDHKSPGTVKEVVKTKRGYNVIVEAIDPSEVGDKLVTRFGSKGVIACYDDQTDLLTRRGWLPFSELTLQDAVAVWNDGQPTFKHPTEIFSYRYDGILCAHSNHRLNFAVTPNHRMWCRIPHYRGKVACYRIREAGDCHAKQLAHRVACAFSLPAAGGIVRLDAANRPKGKPARLEFDRKTFYEFLGWYLSEGSVARYSRKPSDGKGVVESYKVQISQSEHAHPVFCREIERVLSAMGVGWHLRGSQYTFSHKPLYELLKPLGLSHQKRIPRWVIDEGDKDCLSALLQAYAMGDGSVLESGCLRIETTSEGMASDLQEIGALVGRHATVRQACREGRRPTYGVWLSERQEAMSGPEHAALVEYSGQVYCAQVPGGLLYVRRGGVPMWCGNSVVRDDEMPHDADGKPFELLADPEGIISRGNPTLLYDFLLSKVAAKTGKPYKLKDFEDIDDLRKFVKDELEANGMKDKEDVLDPVTGNKTSGILTGSTYMLKLHHTSAAKSQGRGFGAYTSDGTPAKTGGPEGSSKRWSMMDIYAVLAHQGTEVARDAGLIRGQAAPEYWQAFMLGQNPPDPDVPPVFKKTIAHLQGAGINVRRTADQRLHLMAMTDKDVEKMSEHRVIKNPETVNWDDELKPIPGGLFDQKVTGGHGANNWARIELSEKLPSPIMEEPIKRVLGITTPQFRNILAGKEKLYGKTGPEALESALGAINVDQALATARRDMTQGRKGVRNRAIQRLEFLKAAKEQGVHPKDWMISKVPVLPTVFRPVSKMQGSGGTLVADVNHLYKELMEADKNLIDMKKDVDDVSDERTALYDSLKAVTGLGDPVGAKNKERGVKGLLAQVFASSPKYGHMQYKLLGGTLDNVGRAVISPDSNLDLDQVGIPEDTAWTVYRPYIIRRLVRHGVNPQQAVTMATEKNAQGKRDPLAKRFLMDEMEARPVLVNRAPVLHKYGYLALKPKLTAGRTLRVSPLITKGLGADFDGDAQVGAVFALISKEAEVILEQYGINTMFWSQTEMPYSPNLGIPTTGLGRFVCVNLEDFPHGDKLKTTEGEKGPIDWYSVPPGVQVLAYDENTEQVAWADVDAWSVHHAREIYLVNLESGRQIVTDDDHRAVYGIPAGSLLTRRARPAEAVGLKMMVPRVQTLPDFGNDIGFLDTQSALRRYNESKDMRIRNSFALLDRIPLDEDFGYVLGAIIGDGWVSAEAPTVVIAGITDEIMDKCHRCIAKLFVDTAPKRCDVVSPASYGNSRRSTWGAARLVEVLRPLVGHGADNKHLPEFFLKSPKEFRYGLLAGLMDTDGTISVNSRPQLLCQFQTNSIRLAQEFVWLTASLGIRTTIVPSKTPAGRPCWQLVLSTPAVRRWNARGMVHPVKLAALEKAPPLDENSAIRNDRVPISTELAIEIRKSIGFPKDKSKFKEGQLAVYSGFADAAKRGYISRGMAERVEPFLRDDAPKKHPDWAVWWRIVASKEVTWDLVTGSTATGIRETGYDLTVPGYETFTSVDGVVLSNTMNFTVPASDKAVKQAMDRMLPSKSLLSPADFKSPMFAPSQQFQIGLWEGSSKINKQRPVRVFRNTRDVAAAMARGEIDHETKVRVLEDPK